MKSNSTMNDWTKPAVKGLWTCLIIIIDQVTYKIKNLP